MQKMKANDQMAAFMSEAAKIRRPEDRIVAIIAEYDLAALGKPDLSEDLDEPSPRQKLMQGIRNRLKRELAIREILLHFREDKRISHIIDLALHERERNAYEERRAAHALPHIVTDEERHEHQAARDWLFGELKYIHQTAIANFGAAAALQMQGATMLGGHAFPDEDETLLDQHLDTLIKMIPKECKRRLDIVANVKDAFPTARELKKAASDGAKSGAEKAVPMAYRKAMNAEPGEDPFEPPKRKKGAGRKRTHDLDGKQVDAVLNLALKNGRSTPANEDAAAIIRRGGNFKKPFTKTASLISAARRELAKRHEPKTSKSRHRFE